MVSTREEEKECPCILRGETNATEVRQGNMPKYRFPGGGTP